MFAHECLIPTELQEDLFVQCVVNSMDKYQQLVMKQALDITNDQDLANQAIIGFRTGTDCIGLTGLNLPARSHCIKASIRDFSWHSCTLLMIS